MKVDLEPGDMPDTDDLGDDQSAGLGVARRENHRAAGQTYFLVELGRAEGRAEATLETLLGRTNRAVAPDVVAGFVPHSFNQGVLEADVFFAARVDLERCAQTVGLFWDDFAVADREVQEAPVVREVLILWDLGDVEQGLVAEPSGRDPGQSDLVVRCEITGPGVG